MHTDCQPSSLIGSSRLAGRPPHGYDWMINARRKALTVLYGPGLLKEVTDMNLGRYIVKISIDKGR